MKPTKMGQTGKGCKKHSSGKLFVLFSCLSGLLKDKKDKKDMKGLKEQKSSDKKLQKLKVNVQKSTKKDKITKSKTQSSIARFFLMFPARCATRSYVIEHSLCSL
jgi:hypothetical protein